MDWKEKYAHNIEVLNGQGDHLGIAAILTAAIYILQQEKVDYSVMILGDFCRFFVDKDKNKWLEQLQRFAEKGLPAGRGLSYFGRSPRQLRSNLTISPLSRRYRQIKSVTITQAVH